MKKNSICKIVFFVAALTLLLAMASYAAADTCTAETGHLGPFSFRNYTNPTCTEPGHRDKYCDACGKFLGTEPIGAIGHQYETSERVITAPTCLSAGLKQISSICMVCKYNGGTKDETMPALGHDWGSWNVTTPATCTTAGVETRICKRDSSHVETQPIAALGHKWDAGKVTKEPDCTTPGSKTYICQNDSSHTRTESIPVVPDAHKWDAGKMTKAPNCTYPGTKTYTCQINSAHIKTETLPIDSNAHDWDNGTVTKAATCEGTGIKTYVCRVNAAHTKTEIIPATGHKWDKGTITKKPTLTDEGEKKYVCQNDSSHVRYEKLPVITMNNNTVCAFGPRLRDVNLYPYNTELWYMFTPFDASKDGTQTYELVASNMYIVGSLTLTIRDGNLTIDYKLSDPYKFTITLEFFTVLNRIGDIIQYEPEDLVRMGLSLKKNQAINLAEKFGDDTNLVLYFCSRCDYTYSQKYSSLNYNSTNHQRLLNTMLSLMD
ncbi:MAG: hypothetical protein IKO52_07475 [Clostridia bacterium]|nr:hypothetical protein [Clostridia bacterium]